MTNETENRDQKYENVGARHGLALPIELEEGAPPLLARVAMSIISGLIVLLLVWANIANVRELSVAMGEIAPFGSTREAAHLEGGIVDEVFVAPGDTVEKGAPLVRLRTENAGGEFIRFETRRADLELRAERLAALAENREPDFEALSAAWPGLVAEQKAVYGAAIAQHRAVMETFAEREASAEAEVKKAEAELQAANDLNDFAIEQLTIQEDLIEEGFTSKQSYLEARSAVATAKSKAIGARSRLDQAQRALTVARADRKGAEAEYQTQVAEERAEVVAELKELEKPIASLKDRSDRLVVRAPISGVVNDMLVFGQGDVVGPGGVVAEITPTGAELMAEVRVNPKDIGHIAIGMKTDVSVTTFDPNRYGKIEGRVAHISADSFSDERTGESYYIAHIDISDPVIGAGERARPLTPGMQVRAEIITQTRTMMQYALKPVSRSLDQAFSER
ncbi:MAG: HlyD family type I secretion periplasmic adaptor subunit [Pseudomonadota bacterium]